MNPSLRLTFTKWEHRIIMLSDMPSLKEFIFQEPFLRKLLEDMTKTKAVYKKRVGDSGYRDPSLREQLTKFPG